MTPERMRAAVMPHPGREDDLRVEEIPTPPLRRGDVLVRVAAAAVNRSDVANIQGAFPQTRFPATPGRDFAGTVENGPPELVGQRVWGTGGDLGFTRLGTMAEYIVLPRAAATLVPATLTLPEAATVGVAFVTAFYGLVEVGRMRAGETVVVTGANGAVGTAALQIARWSGARPIAAVRRSEPAVLSGLCELGADAIVNAADGDLRGQILSATGGRGADLILDCVGIEVDTTLQSLAARGRQVALAARGDPWIRLNLREFYHREARLLGIDTLKLSTVDCARLLAKLEAGFSDGSLRPPTIAQTFSLARIQEAFALVRSGAAEGKVVVLP